MHYSTISAQCSVSLLAILMFFGVLGYPHPRTSPPSVSADSTNSSGHTCPPPTDIAKPLRYHIPSGKCYRIKTKGPCANNQIFYKIENGKIYGECDCPITGREIPWIYHQETDQCYKSFEQGYCSSGQWLIFDSDDNPKCVANQCLKEVTSAPPNATIILFNGKCVTLNKASPLCKADEIVSFEPNETNPSCINDENPPLFFNIGKTSQLKCKPGTRRDIVGKCRTSIQSQSAFSNTRLGR